MGEPMNDAKRTQQAVALAEQLLVEAKARTTTRERARRRRLARLIDDPAGREVLLRLTDEVVRIEDPRRAAERFRAIVGGHSLRAFGGVDRLGLHLARMATTVSPRAVMPLVRWRLRYESHGIVLPAERWRLWPITAQRRRQGYTLNVSPLGEAVLGDTEADHRLQTVLTLIAQGHISHVSVKISSLCAQLDVLAFDHEVERIAARLRLLYRATARRNPPVLVTLDMEEYRDLHLTVAAFRRVLDEPEFAAIEAGLAIQAYLPDSVAIVQSLCEWANDRHRRAGGRVRIRVVKGANLAMEVVDAEIHGWPAAPFATKAEVDANFKRLLDLALAADPAALQVGAASHNLFDIAWALGWRAEDPDQRRPEIEMLAGMAAAESAVVRQRSDQLLLYAPLVRRVDFESAIAYLVRRLDENTAPENFLRAMFSLDVGTPRWDAERSRFERAVSERLEPASPPHRNQKRNEEDRRFGVDDPFVNEPDTDWTSADNRSWITDALERWRGTPRPLVPASLEEDVVAPATGAGESPVPEAGTYTYVQADLALVERSVALADSGSEAWARRSPEERRALLCRVAEELAAARGDLCGAMAADTGKTVGEGDVEVSEAVDFARYYAHSTRLLEQLASDGLRFAPYRVVVVASPWNFPLSIPAGGVLAALAAGSAVILKPAPEAVLTARRMAECCWTAGVPRDALQFLPTTDDDVGQRLITHPGVDAVVLTGSYDTAQLFLRWKPELQLHAETSGKNAIVVTATADLDVAVRDIVRSAFGHAGQKCSAASLVIAEASVYDGDRFRDKLRDAVSSLRVGSSFDLATQMGPLIRPPEGPLERALHHLDEGEAWLVRPRQYPGTQLWSPAVKLGVQAGSAFHQQECFGPVLGVMKARDLDHALELQNGTPYGLTAGLQALDPAEIERWIEGVEAGNLYVNRSTTGAIVQRQPFGGWKRSSVGVRVKAGGPNYVAAFGSWSDAGSPTLDTARRSFRKWWDREFSREHDPTGLRAETNRFRYRPLPHVVLRLGAAASKIDADIALAAAETAGVRVSVSVAGQEPDDQFLQRLGALNPTVVRVLGGASEALLRGLHDAGIAIDQRPVVAHGRIELLRWMHEQVVSRTMHRYGNVY